MEETFSNAKEELKRAEHLIYVSLKYTRTVDVIKSIVERLINACDFGIDLLLKKAKKDKKIKEVPTIPRIRIDTVKSAYSNDELIRNCMEFYSLLRKIDKARFDRAQEYRRHVTMTAYLDEGEIELTIDIISDYFERTKEFLDYIEKLVFGEKE
jgi:hypothetical protein